MKRLLIITTILSLLVTSNSYAQKGDAAIGIRATPDGGGFNGKVYITNHLAFEGQLNAGGIVGLEGESFNAVALLEGVITLPDPSWRIFFGGGLHAGAWDRGRWYRESDGEWIYDRPEPLFGISGIGGVEYVFKNIPLNLSADIKPSINLINGPEFFPHNMFGLSARYYFNR